jgi:pimeloyl-ACP methyl ester carboxylesterase
MSLVPTLLGGVLRAAGTVSPQLGGRLAFRLFRHPGPRAKVRGGERDLLDQAQAELLPLRGQDIAVYRWGDGTRPVLMLHGWSSRGSRYTPLVPGLAAAGYTAVTFDAPGHGRSSGRSTDIRTYAAIAGRLIEQYGPFEAVIGHSFGALTAFHALRDPGVSAARLATIGSPSDFDYLPTRFARQLGLGGRLEAELRRRTEGYFADEADVWHRFSATYRPADLPIPMLVVHDEDDAVVDYSQAHRIVAAHGSKARLVTTRGLGHHRILAAPAVVEQVLDFVTAAPVTP